jgi:hypothetical protein
LDIIQNWKDLHQEKIDYRRSKYYLVD